MSSEKRALGVPSKKKCSGTRTLIRADKITLSNTAAISELVVSGAKERTNTRGQSEGISMDFSAGLDEMSEKTSDGFNLDRCHTSWRHSPSAVSCIFNSEFSFVGQVRTVWDT